MRTMRSGWAERRASASKRRLARSSSHGRHKMVTRRNSHVWSSVYGLRMASERVPLQGAKEPMWLTISLCSAHGLQSVQAKGLQQSCLYWLMLQLRSMNSKVCGARF